MSNTIYFYHQNGRYGFLSNFYPCYFMHDGRVFSSSEQMFMKKKQETFDPDNNDLSDSIMRESDPIQVKIMGRNVANYDENVWKLMRFKLMIQILLLKFSQNSDLRSQLIRTGDSILAEASPTDKIWGIGISKSRAENNEKWKGKNLLGRALMKVRSILQKIYGSLS